MPRTPGSAFDALLETFGTDEDRTAFQSLAERNPKVREFGLRQDDYSRQLNDHQKELQELQSWRDWRNTNWDADKKMTKAERVKQERLEALQAERDEIQAKLAAAEIGGSDMTFDDVERIATEAMKKSGFDPNKFVGSDALSAKEKEVRDYMLNLNGSTARMALRVPYLNRKHEKEFGDQFDPDKFIEAATKAGKSDLDEFYEEFTAKTRMDRIKADADEKVRKAQEDADAKVAAANQRVDEQVSRLQGMGKNGANPADTDGSEMGALQRKMLGLNKPKDGDSGAPEVPLGEGGVANYAAREFINRQAGR